MRRGEGNKKNKKSRQEEENKKTKPWKLSRKKRGEARKGKGKRADKAGKIGQRQGRGSRDAEPRPGKGQPFPDQHNPPACPKDAYSLFTLVACRPFAPFTLYIVKKYASGIPISSVSAVAEILTLNEFRMVPT